MKIKKYDVHSHSTFDHVISVVNNYTGNLIEINNE